ncbi:hypothetical protein ACODT3_43960 [Streptomyces sp. 4.24]|uniref:hypothetical protein n=1 Tax=Streptomyces tritrimontium TaxID=3406573 RepID=UPI003BB604DC
MLLMEPHPIPCPAKLIPDATGGVAFAAAYRAAKSAGVTYVGIERRGRHWTVKSVRHPSHAVSPSAASAVREAVALLCSRGEARGHTAAGPDYVLLNGVVSAERARELAAALHAALYGDFGPLARAVPDAC